MIHATIKSKIGEDISILFRPDNHPWHYLCECGMASDLTVKEIQNLNAIFISHLHIDHFINFDNILRLQLGIGRKVVVCGPKGIASQIQSKIKAYTWNLIESNSVTYEIREIISEKEVHIFDLFPPNWDLIPRGIQNASSLFSNEAFEVQYTLLDHGTPSIAYLFKEFDKVNIDLSGSPFEGGKWVRNLKSAFEDKANIPIDVNGEVHPSIKLFHLLKTIKGFRMGVIMDHATSLENHAKISTLFQNADQVFIESYYKNSDAEFAKLNHHSYAQKSGEIMAKLNVKQAIPVHFSRRYETTEITQLLNEFNKALGFR
ncbi:hypothetical protein OAF63_06155 [Saprospiraceae bacterium]|jgi:ribonuclease Z|nr:peptidase [Bacteroidota bacterium]MDB4728355.1 hypothetical protein [Saprospiraceae bacterium]MDF1868205.1 hypothetical protein [Saprospiraceae bacterium]